MCGIRIENTRSVDAFIISFIDLVTFACGLRPPTDARHLPIHAAPETQAFHKLHGGGQQHRADDHTETDTFQSIFVTLTEEYFKKTV